MTPHGGAPREEQSTTMTRHENDPRDEHGSEKPEAPDALDGGPAQTQARLSPADIDALDILAEHGFDLARAVAAAPEQRARLEAVLRELALLERHEVEPPDAALTDATLARIARADEARDARMRFSPAAARGAGGAGGRWPDLWALASVALIAVAVGLPIARWMQARAGDAACADNLRGLGTGVARYVRDHDAMPFQASVMPDLGKLGSWVGLGNNRHLEPLAEKNYCDARCRCCPNDASGEGYAYQVPNRSLLPAWQLGARIPFVADRNPVIDLLRAGEPVGMCIINSPEHGGRGQNALFTDVSVEFMASPAVAVPAIAEQPAHVENIWLPMTDSPRGPAERALGDAPSDWLQFDVFLLQ